MTCSVTVVSKSADVCGSLVGFKEYEPHMHLAFGEAVSFDEPGAVSLVASCRSLADVLHDLQSRIQDEYHAEDQSNEDVVIRLADRVFWTKVTLQGMKCC